MMFPKQSIKAMNAFYGNPDANSDGVADPVWEARNLVKIPVPYFMTWSWSKGSQAKSLTLHKLCAGQFERALVRIGKEFSAEQLNATQLNQCGGAYNFRLMRGVNRLSIHSWGAAIDLAPEKNWLGRSYDERLGMMPMKVVQIFADEGISWGGRWSRQDAMHFQAAYA